MHLIYKIKRLFHFILYFNGGYIKGVLKAFVYVEVKQNIRSVSNMKPE